MFTGCINLAYSQELESREQRLQAAESRAADVRRQEGLLKASVQDVENAKALLTTQSTTLSQHRLVRCCTP